MDIKELRELRNSLLLDQIRISELIDEKRVEKLNENMGCEMVGDVLKITINDYPPRSVFMREMR